MCRNNLLKIMKEKNITYRKLHALSGISISTLYHIANQEIDSRQSTMIAIAKALEMDVEDVFYLDWKKNNI